ncbi:MAG: hypothetical protein QM756_00845 [Polyangiaceae bacterium]
MHGGLDALDLILHPRKFVERPRPAGGHAQRFYARASARYLRLGRDRRLAQRKLLDLGLHARQLVAHAQRLGALLRA